MGRGEFPWRTRNCPAVSSVPRKKNSHYRKVKLWQETQSLYIPATCINTLRIENDNPKSFDTTDTTVSLELLLPSAIRNRIPWDKQSGEYEWLLHEAQAHDSLHKLQDSLRLKDYLLKKKKNVIPWCSWKYMLTDTDWQCCEEGQDCYHKIRGLLSAASPRLIRIRGFE